MPSKRAVLQQFKRDELLAAVDRFGLEVRDRRVREQLVDALAGSRKAHLADAFEEQHAKALSDRFDALVRGLHCRISNAWEEIEMLTKIRGYLLPKLISGELRVQNAERFIEGLSDG